MFGESGSDLPWSFAVPTEMLESVEPGTREAFEALLAALGAGGARSEVAETSVGDLDEYLAAFRAVQGAEAWRNNGAWLREHPGAVAPAVAFQRPVPLAEDASAVAVAEPPAAEPDNLPLDIVDTIQGSPSLTVPPGIDDVVREERPSLLSRLRSKFSSRSSRGDEAEHSIKPSDLFDNPMMKSAAAATSSCLLCRRRRTVRR